MFQVIFLLYKAPYYLKFGTNICYFYNQNFSFGRRKEEWGSLAIPAAYLEMKSLGASVATLP